MNKEIEEIKKALPLMNERMKGEFIGAARTLLMLKEGKDENDNKTGIQPADRAGTALRDMPEYCKSKNA